MTEPLLTEDWDLTADATGSLAMASEELSIAQAVGNEIKLIRGEGWYDTAQGLPLFEQIIGSSGLP